MTQEILEFTQEQIQAKYDAVDEIVADMSPDAQVGFYGSMIFGVLKGMELEARRALTLKFAWHFNESVTPLLADEPSEEASAC